MKDLSSTNKYSSNSVNKIISSTSFSARSSFQIRPQIFKKVTIVLVSAMILLYVKEGMLHTGPVVNVNFHVEVFPLMSPVIVISAFLSPISKCFV